jgi:pimeloyl-ACP methyl ester carboxylesterase
VSVRPLREGRAVAAAALVPSYRGSGSGPPLLLLNGYAATHADWDPAFLGALGAHAEVLAVDHRGMGDTPRGEGPITVEVLARDALALLDARGLDRVDVTGWSMGGMVAQALAALAPERVRRLVLLSTDPGGPEAVLADAGVWGRLTDHGGTPREQATRLLEVLFPPPLAADLDAQVGDLVAAARATLDPDVLTAQEYAIARWHAEPAGERLARISAPVLVAAGEQDLVIPAANAGLLAGALPGARLALFPGGGHAFMAQEPAALAALIAEHLRA